MTSSTSDLSIFSEVDISLQCALYPRQMANMMEAVETQINAMLFNFNHELGGIPLFYNDITIPTGKEQCRILGEHSWLHLEVSTKMIIFTPTKGAVLRGHVTSVSSEHVALLVFGVVNASVSKELLKSSYVFNAELQRWEGVGLSISEGDMMDIAIQSHFHNNGIIQIHASPAY